MGIFIKIIVLILGIFIALTSYFLDYIWHDKRTKRFKISKNLLIFLTFLFLFGSIYSIYYDGKEMADKEKKSEIAKKEELRNQKIFYESQLNLLERINQLAINTIVKTDSITNRTELLNYNLIKNFKSLNIETNKIKYPISEIFYASIVIGFKNIKLSNNLISKYNWNQNETYTNDPNNSHRVILLNNSELDDSIHTLASFECNKLFNRASLSLVFENSNLGQWLNLGNWNFNLTNNFHLEYDKLDKSKRIFSSILYHRGGHMFTLSIENIPLQINSIKNITSLLDFKNLNLTTYINFDSNSEINGTSYFYTNQLFELYSISLMNNYHEVLSAFKATKIYDEFIKNYSYKFENIQNDLPK